MKKDEYYQYTLETFRPAETMLKMVPEDKLDWQPGPSFMTLGQLICHLAGGVGGELRMAIDNSWPNFAEMTEAMKQIPSCNVTEALAKLEKDKAALKATLDSVSEEDFAGKIIEVPWGAKSNMEKMALYFRDHFVHHKMQLFIYLKLLGFPVNTGTLYMG
jgi:uncharacterized damage-inducible protein DinB